MVYASSDYLNNVPFVKKDSMYSKHDRINLLLGPNLAFYQQELQAVLFDLFLQ